MEGLDSITLGLQTDRTLGSKCYYGWHLYYAWVQMLLQMGPLLHCAVITLVPSTFVRVGLALPYFPGLFFKKTSFKMADGQSKTLKESMSHIDQGLNLERKGYSISAIP